MKFTYMQFCVQAVPVPKFAISAKVSIIKNAISACPDFTSKDIVPAKVAVAYFALHAEPQ